MLLNARFGPMGLAVVPYLKGGPIRRALEGQAVVDASWALASRGGGRFDREPMIGAAFARKGRRRPSPRRAVGHIWAVRGGHRAFVSCHQMPGTVTGLWWLCGGRGEDRIPSRKAPLLAICAASP